MLNKFFSVVLALVIILLGASVGNTQVPQLINYQGVLTDAADNPITGERSIQFKIYNTLTGGTALWSETQTVTVTEGLLSVLLGSITPIPYSVFDGSDKYLALQVESDPEMAPRKRLVSVGYAFRAYEADKVDGRDASYFSASTHNHDSRYYTQSLLRTSDGTAPNVGSNRVSWKNLRDVPAGFADEIDHTGGAVGDNLGNHIATQNVQLRSYWLSGDGGNEGIRVSSVGNVGVGISGPGQKLDVGGSIRSTIGYIVTATPTSPGGLSTGDISSTDDVLADDIVRGGRVAAGLPSHAIGTGDVVADDDLIADDDLYIYDDAYVTGDVHSNAGYIVTGTPTSPGGLSAGDISSTDDVLADDIIRAGGRIIAGFPSTGHGAGDVAATDDLVADDDLYITDDAFVTGDVHSNAGYIVTGTPTSPGGLSAGDISSTDDVLADDIVRGGRVASGLPSSAFGAGDVAASDDLIADDDLFVYGGTKSAVLTTSSFGERLMYCDESTEVYFFDRGQAQLVNGEVTVYLDPIFLETVTIDGNNSLLVQITLNADCNGVYVTDRSATSFTVRELGGGTSHATFTWEACAKRQGFETTRLELMEEDGPVYAQDEPNGPEVTDAVHMTDAAEGIEYSQDEPNGPEVRDAAPMQEVEDEQARTSNDDL